MYKERTSIKIKMLRSLFAFVPFLALMLVGSVGALSNSDYWPEYSAFYTAAGGPNWLNKNGWLNDSVSICSWHGIECAANISSVDPLQVIQKIMLNDNGLSGTIAWNTLTPLIGLQYLDLDSNFLTGDLSFFAQKASLPLFQSISYFDLSHNLLRNQIPDLNFPSLDALLLGYNHFQGSLPPFTHLKKMTYLDIQANGLSYSLPDLDLPMLTTLYLQNNSFTGFYHSICMIHALSSFPLMFLVQGRFLAFRSFLYSKLFIFGKINSMEAFATSNP